MPRWPAAPDAVMLNKGAYLTARGGDTRPAAVAHMDRHGYKERRLQACRQPGRTQGSNGDPELDSDEVTSD